jgi:hypothetical protein
VFDALEGIRASLREINAELQPVLWKPDDQN